VTDEIEELIEEKYENYPTLFTPGKLYRVKDRLIQDSYSPRARHYLTKYFEFLSGKAYLALESKPCLSQGGHRDYDFLFLGPTGKRHIWCTNAFARMDIPNITFLEEVSQASLEQENRQLCCPSK